MSKSKGGEKRKRQNDAAEDGASKKSKKVKQIDVEAPAAPAEADPAPQKEVKSKKSKKSKSSSDGGKTVTDEPATNGTPNGQSDATPAHGNDEAMTDAPETTSATTASKKSKKSKKNKESKKADNVPDVTEEQAQGVSEDVDVEMVDAEAAALEKKAKKERKREKKEKKAKKAADQSEALQEGEQNGAVASDDVNGAAEHEAPAAKKSKKSKKSKKNTKASKESEEQSPDVAMEDPEVAETSTEVAGADAEAGEQPEAGGEDSEKKDRFIVFVGNLPYSATREQIEAHFEKLKPFELRMRTYKRDSKGGKGGGFMGTCFIEFPRYDRMQTALQKYHHSVFSNGEGPKNERKINVELSAGGGGNKPARMEKIKAKNEKLANERQRNHEKREEIESKQQERKDKKAARGIKNNSGEAETKTDEPVQENHGMHPSRLAFLNQPVRQWKPRVRY